MNFLKSSNVKFICAITLTMTVTSGVLFFQQSKVQRLGKMAKLNSGVNTCFSRVAQSFTALMIADRGSSYLANDFMTVTGDCFSAANQFFQNVFDQKFKNGHNTINQLVSDVHWFHEKVGKLVQMSGPEGMDFTQSNVSNKFSNLENSKLSLSDGIEAQISKIEGDISLLTQFATVGVVLTFFLGGLWFVATNKKGEEKERIEQFANTLLYEKNYVDADDVARKALSFSGFDNVLALYNESIAFKYMQSPVVADLTPPAQELESSIVTTQKGVNLDSSFNVALKGIQNKAFTHGVLIDFDIDENISVKGDSEELEQVFFQTLNYSLESSIAFEQGRKIIVRSISNGNTSGVKFNIANHCFNSSELDYLCGNSNQTNGVNTGLVLIREVMNEFEGDIEVRNTINSDGNLTGSEISIMLVRTFTPAPAEEALPAIPVDEKGSKIISIVKGKEKRPFKSDEIRSLSERLRAHR